jgi:hypothetical protein
MLQKDFVRKASKEFDIIPSFIYKQLKINNENKNLSNERIEYYQELFKDLKELGYKIW